MTPRPNPIRASYRGRDERDLDGGFTLVELLIVVVIIPLVIGAISVALISVITQQSNVSNKVSDSQDTQQVSASFVQDVQSAYQITTFAQVTSPAPCGNNPPILSLTWGISPQTVVSYDVIQRGSGFALLRNVCTNGGSPASKVLSYDVQNTIVPVITGQSCQPGSFSCSPMSAAAAAAAGWAYTAGVQGVVLNVNANFTGDQSYSYTLTGVPRLSTSSSLGAPPPGHPTALSLGTTGTTVQCAGSSNASITVNGTLQINSTSSPVASVNNNATISADQIDTGSTSSSALPNTTNISPNPPSQQNVTVQDPYQGLTPPVTGLLTATLTPGTTYQGLNVYGSAYQGPGIYTGTLSVPNNTTTTLASGVYVLMNGISLSGNQSIVSANTGGTDGNGGVLLYAFRGSVNLTGNGTATLSPFNFAPSTYAGAPSPWPNIVIWQDGLNGQGTGDPGDANAVALAGNGNGNVVNGTVYAPEALVGGAGNGSVVAGSVVSAGLACNGNGNLTIG